MKQNYVKQALLALAFCATMPTFAIEFPSIGEAPQNGKTYMLLSRSNPTNFMTRTSWDGAFYLLPYNKEDIKKAVIKAVKNDNGTWSFTHDEVTLEEDSSEVITTYYVGIPSGTDNLNVNFSEPVEWTIENGDYTGFYKLKAGEGQGNELTIGGYLHLNAGNQYAIINDGHSMSTVQRPRQSVAAGVPSTKVTILASLWKIGALLIINIPMVSISGVSGTLTYLR